MRLKITITLLALLLALLTYIFYLDSRLEAEGEFELNRRAVLGDLAIGIDQFSISNPGSGARISLELRDAQWMLTEPYEWPANEFAVEKILTHLRFLERITSFETNLSSPTGAALSDYGLSPPSLSFQFGRGDDRHTLAIGKPTEIGNQLYILSPDQSRIHVVDRSLLETLGIGLDQLRSPRLFDTAVFEATSWNIQVRDNNRNLRARFAREGDEWVFETPIRARADTAAVNTLLSRCLNLETQSIVASNPTDLAPYGLQSSLYRIAVESSQQREALEIGNLVSPDSEFRYAKREDRPTIFQIRVDFLDLLANAQTKLRQRRIFELDVTEATTVTIEQREQPPLTLQKLENESWEVVTRDEGQGIQTLRGDTRAIEEILLWLNELKAVPDTGFVNDAPSAPDLESYGLEVPEFAISVTARRLHQQSELSPTQTETLLIGDRSPQDRHESFIKIASRDYVYAVYNDLFDRIDAQPRRYQDRTAMELPSNATIESIAINRVSDEANLAAFDFSADPANLPAHALALRQELNPLVVESYLPQGFTSTIEIAGRQLPWSYHLLLSYRSPDASSLETKTLYVSELTGGPALFGAYPQDEISFRFQQSFIDAFSPVVFERQPRERSEEPFSTRPLPEPEPEDPEQPTPGDLDDSPANEPVQSDELVEPTEPVEQAAPESSG